MRKTIRTITIATAAAIIPLTLTTTPAHATPQGETTTRSTKTDTWAVKAVDQSNASRRDALKQLAAKQTQLKQLKTNLTKNTKNTKNTTTRTKQLTTQKTTQTKQLTTATENLTRNQLILTNYVKNIYQSNGFKGAAQTIQKVADIPTAETTQTLMKIDPLLLVHRAELNKQKQTLQQTRTRLTHTLNQLNKTTKQLTNTRNTENTSTETITNLTNTITRAKHNIPTLTTFKTVKNMKMTTPTFHTPEQLKKYTDTLRQNNIPLIPASEMNNPETWPAGYLPVPTNTGTWQYGVAQAKLKTGGTILILPKETVEAFNTGLQQLGVPYLWGGTTPRGFDCSGLMGYMFNPQNVTIPRVARDQQDFGISVSPENILPGDLVFFGNPAHHVGIYAGAGKMLEAPRTGLDVRIADDRTPTSIGRLTIR